MSKILDSLKLPEDLRSLSPERLQAVASELRNELIEKVATSGGHFASSLGATELTVALHYAFTTPEDKLIWDVGHQCYIHKMVTGRRDAMPSIRKFGGISGFLRRDESIYDTFGAGHAGTSISAGVGISYAFQKSDPERYVVSIIGDGSITAGMAFEALNHAGALGLNKFIVVLNDNEMSISPNVGAVSWLLSKAITSNTSNKARTGIKNLYKKGYMPEIVYKAMDRAEEATLGFFASPSMLFESFGFRYIGPVDGHSMPELLTGLERAKTQDVPVLMHIITKKGQGYSYAEDDPIKWHAVNPFNKDKGEIHLPKVTPPPTYTSIFADTLIKIAEKDVKVIAITAAMAGGTGLDSFAKKFSGQFTDVGICEQHAVTFAAGLAISGYRPVCAIYSTFLQRAFDQVVHDVCIQNLPVCFAIDRAGVVGNDGETHQGVFDLGYLRMLPNMTIMSPADENELQHMLYTAVYHNGPIAVRYPRGAVNGITLDDEFQKIPIGKSEIIQKGDNILFICIGTVIEYAKKVSKLIFESKQLTSTIVNARFVKPLDIECLKAEIPKHILVCTIEDHALIGGFGSAVLEAVNDFRIPLQKSIVRFGVGDDFVPHGSQAEQHKLLGYDVDGIYKKISELI
jgi:1-deoxy-D-xylulose-5-phosphate synthase